MKKEDIEYALNYKTLPKLSSDIEKTVYCFPMTEDFMRYLHVAGETMKLYYEEHYEKQTDTQHDIIHNPSHYCQGRKYEPKDVIRDWELNFNLGSAIKYISRAGRKGDIVQDLKKAQQFMQFEIEYLEQENKE